MGNCATVQVVCGEEFSPIAYVHWIGGDTLDVIEDAAPKMRSNDVSYAFARLCGHLHLATGALGALGFGVYNTDEIQTEDTVGDAGHYRVDLATGIVTNWSPEPADVATLKFFQG